MRPREKKSFRHNNNRGGSIRKKGGAVKLLNPPEREKGGSRFGGEGKGINVIRKGPS